MRMVMLDRSPADRRGVYVSSYVLPGPDGAVYCGQYTRDETQFMAFPLRDSRDATKTTSRGLNKLIEGPEKLTAEVIAFPGRFWVMSFRQNYAVSFLYPGATHVKESMFNSPFRVFVWNGIGLVMGRQDWLDASPRRFNSSLILWDRKLCRPRVTDLSPFMYTVCARRQDAHTVCEDDHDSLGQSPSHVWCRTADQLITVETVEGARRVFDVPPELDLCNLGGMFTVSNGWAAKTYLVHKDNKQYVDLKIFRLEGRCVNHSRTMRVELPEEAMWIYSLDRTVPSYSVGLRQLSWINEEETVLNVHLHGVVTRSNAYSSRYLTLSVDLG